ncbi:predicted protein [Naegleria gruberi]|uniref:Predicted protein n=1 Tax=Naegleria gruberi TaxID=5762 RepID=D2VWM3_NAEGR|nr:uncharacterized protein NAEGRDRAFT_73430 [Naegleria gruberi]EFC38720.1 predicted protein [Naegleria gruberi]|eukprot:XP_002671464.1 predicted protein [Naegleria gruberi strain NEG-M]
MNQLLKQATQLENKIEQKLITYQNLATKIEDELFQEPIVSNNISTSEQLFEAITEEIDHLLKELREVNDRMKEFIKDENNHSILSSSIVYQYEQHETFFNRIKQEFKSRRQRLANKKNRNDLLYISDEEDVNNENDSLLGSSRESEIQRLRDTNIRMQNLITQGHTSKAALEEQMEIFRNFDRVLNNMKGKSILI